MVSMSILVKCIIQRRGYYHILTLLKSSVKVKMAEDTVKRVTGLNPLYPNVADFSSLIMPIMSGSPDADASESSIPLQSDPNCLFQESLALTSETRVSPNSPVHPTVTQVNHLTETLDFIHPQARIQGGASNSSGSVKWDGSKWDPKAHVSGKK